MSASARAAATGRALTSHMLFRADFTPMLSPQLAASIGGVKEPADLLRLPILDPSDPLVGAMVRRCRRRRPMSLARRPGSSMGSQAYEAAPRWPARAWPS